jgi:hypothetical protein
VKKSACRKVTVLLALMLATNASGLAGQQVGATRDPVELALEAERLAADGVRTRDWRLVAQAACMEAQIGIEDRDLAGEQLAEPADEPSHVALLRQALAFAAGDQAIASEISAAMSERNLVNSPTCARWGAPRIGRGRGSPTMVRVRMTLRGREMRTVQVPVDAGVPLRVHVAADVDGRVGIRLIDDSRSLETCNVAPTGRTASCRDLPPSTWQGRRLYRLLITNAARYSTRISVLVV